MKYYVVDAFTKELFAGNPAGICPVADWPEERLMQSIAAENNLSETAFIRKSGEKYDIRWFTPTGEFDLCGHATLASGFVVMNLLEPGRQAVDFSSMSGPLRVTREGELYQLDFPARPPRQIAPLPIVAQALGARPRALYLARDHVALFDTADEVRALAPDFDAMRRIEGCIGLVATAPGDGSCDFVSRYFAPHDGIVEDPVTGSAHCTLVPFWSERLGRREVTARQISARGGTLYCRDEGERVLIAGHAALYLAGELHL